MHQGDGDDAESEEIEGLLGDGVEIDARGGRLRGLGIEGVAENAADDVEGLDGSVGGDRHFLVIVEGAHVVEAQDVVGVGVRVEDGVDAGDVGAQGLGAEVGRGVDQHIFAGVLHQHGRAEAVVARICGGAGGAGAADGGDSRAGARA